MQTGRSLREQAYEALDRAMAAQGDERRDLIDEAARLHRLAVAEEESLPLEAPQGPPKGR